MRTAPSLFLAFVLCAALGCSDNGSSGDASTSQDAPRGDSATTGGTGGGSGGTGGSGGSDAATMTDAQAVSCQACVDCAEAACASGIAQCQADTACAAVYDCVTQCTATPQSCAASNPAGALAGATLFTCINQYCAQDCTY